MPHTLTFDAPPLTFDPPRLPRSRDLGAPVQPICVGLEPADLASLDALSVSQRVNRSALVRRAIRLMLAAHTGKNAQAQSSKNVPRGTR